MVSTIGALDTQHTSALSSHIHALRRAACPCALLREPACHLEGSQQLLQDYFRERSRKEKERTAAGKKAALINSGQSDDEMSDDGLKQYEGQF